MPSYKFFDNTFLKIINDNTRIWLVNVKGDGNCGYHAVLSAVLNSEDENMAPIIQKLRKTLSSDDLKKSKKKEFRSETRSGAKLRHYLYKHMEKTSPRVYNLSVANYNTAKTRVQSGDKYRGGRVGNGWMQNDELQMLSKIFKLNIFVQSDKTSSTIIDTSYIQIGDYRGRPNIYIYNCGVHFQVIDHIKSGLVGVGPAVNISMIGAQNVPNRKAKNNIGMGEYMNFINKQTEWREIVQKNENGEDVIIFYDHITGKLILPGNYTQPNNKAGNNTRSCNACTYKYNISLNKCPICLTSKYDIPPDIRDATEIDASVLYSAHHSKLQSAKEVRDAFKQFDETNSLASAKVAKKALELFRKNENKVFNMQLSEIRKVQLPSKSRSKSRSKSQMKKNENKVFNMQLSEIRKVQLPSKSLSKSRSKSLSKSRSKSQMKKNENKVFNMQLSEIRRAELPDESTSISPQRSNSKQINRSKGSIALSLQQKFIKELDNI
jgi:hypothetical protein